MRAKSPVPSLVILCAIATVFCFPGMRPGVAEANPLPACALLIHVHSWDPDFCLNDPVTECSQVVQYSAVEGDVEFDVYLANPIDFVPPFGNVTFTVQWPQAWQFTSFESCSGGDVETSVNGQEATVQIHHGSPATPDAFNYIGRFRLNVSGFGALHFTVVSFDGEFWGTVGPAQAGVDCTYSYLRCITLTPPCGARLAPELLEIHVPEGGITTGTMLANNWNYGAPCSVEIMESAAWLDLDVDWDEYHEAAEITVHVDAHGLTPGVYPARIRAVSQVVHCSSVLVYVEPVSGVSVPEPNIEAASWGIVKQKYR